MMKLKWIGSLLILAGVVGCKTPDRPNLVEYVNPNIGTVHSRWFFYTPAAEPFGMAKLGASTNGTYGNNQGWEAIGYEDNHTSIDGFPCLHEFQIGGISLMPVTGEVKTNPGKLEDPDKGFRSRFDKKDETARPGYYSVLLKLPGKGRTYCHCSCRIPAIYFPGDGSCSYSFEYWKSSGRKWSCA